jgi:cytochrome c553
MYEIVDEKMKRNLVLIIVFYLVHFFAISFAVAKSNEELIYIVKHDCGSCHGMTLKGGLGPSLLSERMKLQPLEVIKNTIMMGRANTAMPPWQNLLSHEDIEKIAILLREGEIK